MEAFTFIYTSCILELIFDEANISSRHMRGDRYFDTGCEEAHMHRTKHIRISIREGTIRYGRRDIYRKSFMQYSSQFITSKVRRKFITERP